MTNANPVSAANANQNANANTDLKREHPDFSHPQSIVPGVKPGRILESHEPHGVPMKDMWTYQKDHMELVSPLNRRKFEIIVVGTGLAAGAAAAALGELGYKVKAVSYTHLTLPTKA